MKNGGDMLLTIFSLAVLWLAVTMILVFLTLWAVPVHARRRPTTTPSTPPPTLGTTTTLVVATTTLATLLTTTTMMPSAEAYPGQVWNSGMPVAFGGECEPLRHPATYTVPANAPYGRLRLCPDPQYSTDFWDLAPGTCTTAATQPLGMPLQAMPDMDYPTGQKLYPYPYWWETGMVFRVVSACRSGLNNPGNTWCATAGCTQTWGSCSLVAETQAAVITLQDGTCTLTRRDRDVTKLNVQLKAYAASPMVEPAIDCSLGDNQLACLLLRRQYGNKGEAAGYLGFYGGDNRWFVVPDHALGSNTPGVILGLVRSPSLPDPEVCPDVQWVPGTLVEPNESICAALIWLDPSTGGATTRGPSCCFRPTVTSGIAVSRPELPGFVWPVSWQSGRRAAAIVQLMFYPPSMPRRPQPDNLFYAAGGVLVRDPADVQIVTDYTGLWETQSPWLQNLSGGFATTFNDNLYSSGTTWTAGMQFAVGWEFDCGDGFKCEIFGTHCDTTAVKHCKRDKTLSFHVSATIPDWRTLNLDYLPFPCGISPEAGQLACRRRGILGEGRTDYLPRGACTDVIRDPVGGKRLWGICRNSAGALYAPALPLGPLP